MTTFEDGEGVMIQMVDADGKGIPVMTMGYYDMMDCNGHLHCVGSVVLYEGHEGLLQAVIEDVDQIQIRSTVDDELIVIPSVSLDKEVETRYGENPSFAFHASNVSSALEKVED